jgi:hypothetical protein
MAMNITPTYAALTATRGLIEPRALPGPGRRYMQSRRPPSPGRHRAAGRHPGSPSTPAPDITRAAGGRTVVWTTSFAPTAEAS